MKLRFNSRPRVGANIDKVIPKLNFALLQLTPPCGGERSPVQCVKIHISYNSRPREGANRWQSDTTNNIPGFNSRPVGGKQIDGLLQRINYVWCFNSRSREEANKRTYTIAATLLIVLQLPPPRVGGEPQPMRL